MIIHENFLEEKKFAELQHYILSNTFTWSYNHGTSYDPQTPTLWEKHKHMETPQMVRPIFFRKGLTGDRSDGKPQDFHQNILIHDYYFKIPHLHEIINKFGELDLYRMKANLLMPYPNAPEYHAPHRDVVFGELQKIYKSFLFYLNDSDGDTFFFDDNGEITDRVTPKQNTMIEFNSRTLHASSNPTDGPRYVLNSVLSNSTLGLD